MSYCKNCGSEIPAGSRFCVSCGTPADPVPGQKPEKTKKKKGWIAPSR